MKINYKLKRFLKRNTKRLIRYFIYFHLISLLSFNSFALSPYEYKDFATFVGDGTITAYLGRAGAYDTLTAVADFSTANGDDLNDITVAYEEEPEVGIYPFSDFSFVIFDSDNVNVSFNSNDVISMSQTIVLDLHDALASSTFDDFFRIVINYEYGSSPYYHTGSFIISAKEALSSSSIQRYSDYTRVIYNINFSKVLPSVNGTIRSIRYDMYNLTPSSYSLRVYGSKNTTNNLMQPMTYFVGSASNAPIYNLPDDSGVNDYHDKEQGLLDDTDASSETNNIFKEFSNSLSLMTDGLSVITSFLTPFLNMRWFKNILYVSLALGLFSFILNIGITRVTVKSDSSPQSNSSNTKLLNK